MMDLEMIRVLRLLLLQTLKLVLHPEADSGHSIEILILSYCVQAKGNTMQ